jgi:chromate transporter
VLAATLASLSVMWLPFILMIYISRYLLTHKDSRVVKDIFAALRPTIIGLIAAAAILLMNKENFIDYRSSLIFAVAFGVTWKWNIHPILLITLSGIAGYILY